MPSTVRPISKIPNDGAYDELVLIWQSWVGIIDFLIVSMFGFVALRSFTFGSVTMPSFLYSSLYSQM